MKRSEFESKYNNWEGRQLVAVITPSAYGRTALRVQWAGLDEIREAAAICNSWASSPADDQFFDEIATDAEIAKAFDETVETPSDEATETPSDETDTSSSYDKVEVFIKEVVLTLNTSNDIISFGLPNGDLMVASEKADSSKFTLIAKTIEAINKAWKAEMSGEPGWEMPSIYVDHSGKP